MGCLIGTEGVDAEAVVDHVAAAGQFPLGESQTIGPDEVGAIIERAA